MDTNWNGKSECSVTFYCMLVTIVSTSFSRVTFCLLPTYVSYVFRLFSHTVREHLVLVTETVLIVVEEEVGC